MSESSEEVSGNNEKFMVWHDKSIHSWDEIKSLESFRKLKILPALIDVESVPVYLSTNSLINYIDNPNSLHSEITFNMYNSGFLDDMKPPEVFSRDPDNEADNIWVKFPQYNCCPNEYQESNYRNSLFITSKNYVSLPHRDLETPGSSVIALNKGRKLIACIPVGETDFEDLTVDKFFELIMKDRCECRFIDFREGDIASFPYDCFHIVLTLEPSVMSYFQILGTEELNYMEQKGSTFDVSKIMAGKVTKVRDHLCMVSESDSYNLGLDTIFEIRNELLKVYINSTL
jgi:hypothetical protein